MKKNYNWHKTIGINCWILNSPVASKRKDAVYWEIMRTPNTYPSILARTCWAQLWCSWMKRNPVNGTLSFERVFTLFPAIDRSSGKTIKVILKTAMLHYTRLMIALQHFGYSRNKMKIKESFNIWSIGKISDESNLLRGISIHAAVKTILK